jgi:hypothetical protein
LENLPNSIKYKNVFFFIISELFNKFEQIIGFKIVFSQNLKQTG